MDMDTDKQKFDTLADDYDRHRPRYPAALLQELAGPSAGRPGLHVVDAGAGTGIALEGLVPILGDGARYEAVDLSPDMVARGRAKFPSVAWTVGPAEPFLERARRWTWSWPPSPSSGWTGRGSCARRSAA